MRGLLLAVMVSCLLAFSGCHAENLLYDNFLKFQLLIWIVSFGLVALFVYLHLSYLKKQKEFIKKAKSIKKDMPLEEVQAIMSDDPVCTETDRERTIIIWEKSQWRGFHSGGTLTRAIKVVCENGVVLYTVGKYLDISVYCFPI